MKKQASGSPSLSEVHSSVGVGQKGFFRKLLAFRKGRVSAISATVRKLAVTLWNMIVKHISYNNEHGYEFLDQKRKRKVKELRKIIAKFNINNEELGFATS